MFSCFLGKSPIFCWWNPHFDAKFHWDSTLSVGAPIPPVPHSWSCPEKVSRSPRPAGAQVRSWVPGNPANMKQWKERTWNWSNNKLINMWFLLHEWDSNFQSTGWWDGIWETNTAKIEDLFLISRLKGPEVVCVTTAIIFGSPGALRANTWYPLVIKPGNGE